VELAPETLRKTCLGHLNIGSRINLERSLAANGRLGGHIVQGHVDSCGTVLTLQPDGEGVMATFQAPVTLMKYIVPKGYIAVDGMSLTVVDTGPDWFTIAFIPHTRAVTIAGDYTPGFPVNLEVDILGKYIEKLLAARSAG
jgi:riboflavin synthase